MFVVVAYDVANDRRRMRLHALLLGYGDPVQESVFECDLEPRDVRDLRRRMARIVRPGADRLRLYVLCRDCVDRIDDVAGEVAGAAPVRVV